MAMREPLPGWSTPTHGEYHIMFVDGLELWAGTRGWDADVTLTRSGAGNDSRANQLAAEDAARAMVADMAKALGMTTVTLTQPERDSATE